MLAVEQIMVLEYITEADSAKFGGSYGIVDFGHGTDNSDCYENNEIQKSYALNLWVR